MKCIHYVNLIHYTHFTYIKNECTFNYNVKFNFIILTIILFFILRVYSRELRFESLSLSVVEVTRLGWLNGSQQTVDSLVVFGCYKPMITDTILVKHLLVIQSNLKKSVSINYTFSFLTSLPPSKHNMKNIGYRQKISVHKRQQNIFFYLLVLKTQF